MQHFSQIVPRVCTSVLFIIIVTMAVVDFSAYIWYSISLLAVVLGIDNLHWLHRGCFIFPESNEGSIVDHYNYNPEVL